MCGIAGIWNVDDRLVRADTLTAMAKVLSHRGPDYVGTHVLGNIGLAHTRLSVIDLTSSGNQPFISNDDRYALVFNGEIYNYEELKESYLQGHTFVSTGDTEVLLQMLIVYGHDALPLLRGMFAFSFFDIEKQHMLLACDPFGKKPLYYTVLEGVFLFASEPKALFASGLIQPVLDEKATQEYFAQEYISAPYTGFLGVSLLQGGHVLDVNSEGEKITTWWEPRVQPKNTQSFSFAVKKMDDLLGRAVERRMVADVPVGLLLSGGLDSSTLLWYMRQVQKDKEIHTFSASFEDTSFNEGDIAAQVAKQFHTEHHEVLFTQEVFFEALKHVVSVLDIPFADASVLPTYAVSALAKQFVKVVLDGDGSDELLGGYGTFDAYELAKKCEIIPRSLWLGAEYALHVVMPVSHKYFSVDFKIKSFVRGVQYPLSETLGIWLGAFSPSELQQLFVKPVLKGASAAMRSSSSDAFDDASIYHVEKYLRGDILTKLDRATMAVGLEARTPFLDKDLAEFVLRLPSSYKRHKKILKQLMENRLPKHIVHRRKQGFGIPVSSWLASDMASFTLSILSKKRINAIGLIRYEYVEHLITEHAAKKKDHRKKLWTLIMFQLWYEYWIIGKRGII